MRSGQIRESCGGCNNAGCRSFLFVDARRPSSPCDTSRKKATHLRCSDSFHSLLSHFPCGSLRSLGKSATFAALTPTHCVRCCPFFRADRRWLSGKKGNALSVLRLVSLPAVAFSVQIASLSGKIRNARCAHFYSFACRVEKYGEIFQKPTLACRCR